MSLLDLPPELLEQVSLHLVFNELPGPPTSFFHFLIVSRLVHNALCMDSNPFLYTTIFAATFDLAPLLNTTFRGTYVSVPVIWKEFARRFQILRSISLSSDLDQVSEHDRHETTNTNSTDFEKLLCVFLMLLENEGNNLRQLESYAFVERWLERFWCARFPRGFDIDGSALSWPEKGTNEALAMWTSWFLYENGGFDTIGPGLSSIVKLYALGAHEYYLTDKDWVSFVPQDSDEPTTHINYLSQPISLHLVPEAAPAILFYLSLTPGDPLHRLSSSRHRNEHATFHSEWARVVTHDESRQRRFVYLPGSAQGVWEGAFTFMDFGLYASLLGGAPPGVLHGDIVIQHRQTWVLREYTLIDRESSSHNEISGGGFHSPTIQPLASGEPLRSYFPHGTRLRETAEALEVRMPSNTALPLIYKRTTEPATQTKPVLDVIIVGESHSAWGHSKLVGRIRPCDGFISITKEYVDGNRGKWLYRGYLVGDSNTKLGGRWRETITPATILGYEGCFAMRRRQGVMTS